MKEKNILLSILIFFIFQNLTAVANVNESAFVEKGNAFLQKVLNNENPELNTIYLNKAQYFFYVAGKNTPPSSEALIGLGRVYSLQGKYNDAKNSLFEAYSVDTYNANASFYLAEFFYSQNDFISALKYYENAQKLGYTDTAKNKEMLVKCRLKLGETESFEN